MFFSVMLYHRRLNIVPLLCGRTVLLQVTTWRDFESKLKPTQRKEEVRDEEKEMNRGRKKKKKEVGKMRMIFIS